MCPARKTGRCVGRGLKQRTLESGLLDIILKNCSVIDGVSDHEYSADIGILEDVIVKVGSLEGFSAMRVIDGAGMTVAPGFIDVHSHSDLNAFIDGGFASKVTQGVTTEVIGNCGYSVYPLSGEFGERVRAEAGSLGVEANWNSFAEFATEVEKRGRLPVNLIPLVGLSAIRALVSGYSSRPLSFGELDSAVAAVEKALAEGVSGVSSGMIYPPCCYFDAEELSALIRPVAACGGIYATHMRSEGDYLLEAISETLQITRKTGVNTQISHLKTAERQNWHKLDAALELIETCMADGFDVAADRYPYTASQTTLDMVLPKWVFDGGNQGAIRRISDPLVALRIKAEIMQKHGETSEYWDNVVISEAFCPEFKKFEGMNFRQTFNMIKSTREDCRKFDIFDCLISFLITEKLRTSAIFFNMSEKNLERILSRPYIMIGSDATARATDGPLASGKPHPRAFGTFVKFLTEYCMRKKLISLPGAISKLTYLPACKFNITGRGRIAPTFFADLVVFDPGLLRERGTYSNPMAFSDGIEYVIVNGKVVFSKKDGKGAVNPGKILTARRNSR